MDLTATGPAFGQRRWSVNPWLLDAAIATAFLVLGLVSTTYRPAEKFGVTIQPLDGWSIVLVVLIAVPYYFRRHAPLTVLILSSIPLVLLVSQDYYEGITPLFVLVGAYSVGSWCPPRRVVIGCVYFAFALTVVWLSGAPGFDFGTFASQVAFYTAAFGIGWSMQSRRDKVAALEQWAVALERESDEESRRAVADERLRIAQELHDVVAHSMGVIAVQSGVGMHVIDTEPAEAKRALEAISTTSRSTLTEIRRLLGVLREEGDGADYAPAPGVDDLEGLVADITTAGIPVTLTLAGDRGEVPHGVELTAYRIVQEALTNVLKHAGPCRATVVVAFDAGVVRIEVTDDGRGVDGRADAGGHGLLGMRERVAVYGGTLDAGIGAGGGFRVAARLPYDAVGHPAEASG